MQEKISSWKEVHTSMKAIKVPPAPPGMKWIFTRFRRVRNSNKVLDAWDYGYQAWPLLVRA
jgi:hypothetical protein